jgi:hypothetical protein
MLRIAKKFLVLQIGDDFSAFVFPLQQIEFVAVLRSPYDLHSETLVE